MSRTITEDQLSWLAGELEAWKDQGLLTSEQARNVLGLYGSAEDFGKQRQSRAITTMLVLSALLVGLGVFLLVAYNWGAIPSAVKVVTILTGLVAMHAGGVALRYRAGWEKSAGAAFF